mgnify:CR=1 FL=1
MKFSDVVMDWYKMVEYMTMGKFRMRCVIQEMTLPVNRTVAVLRIQIILSVEKKMATISMISTTSEMLWMKIVHGFVQRDSLWSSLTMQIMSGLGNVKMVQVLVKHVKHEKSDVEMEK